MKYIIKNCPKLATNYFSCVENQCGVNTNTLCKNISDCLLKQIAEKCDLNVSKVLYEGESLKFIEGNKLASEILELLDIEECE